MNEKKSQLCTWQRSNFGNEAKMHFKENLTLWPSNTWCIYVKDYIFLMQWQAHPGFITCEGENPASIIKRLCVIVDGNLMGSCISVEAAKVFNLSEIRAQSTASVSHFQADFSDALFCGGHDGFLLSRRSPSDLFFLFSLFFYICSSLSFFSFFCNSKCIDVLLLFCHSFLFTYCKMI